MTVVYFSQKTGDRNGDSTAWNTARNGSGSYADPGLDDFCIVQTGHTISSNDQVMGTLITESGGAFNKGAYQLQVKGSLVVEDGGSFSHAAGGHITMTKTGRFEIPGELLNELEIRPGTGTQVRQGFHIDTKEPVVVRGELLTDDAGLDFSDDVDGRVVIPHNAVLIPDTYDYSICARVKWTEAITRDQTIYRKKLVSGVPTLNFSGYHLWYDYSAGELVLDLSDFAGTGYQFKGSFSPTVDREYLLTVRLDDTGARVGLWVDTEELYGMGSYPSDMDTEEPLHIGNYDNSGWNDALQGIIYEWMFYKDTFLTDEQIKRAYYDGYFPSAGRSEWYKFDEGTGATTYSEGGSRSGSIAGTYAWDTPTKSMYDLLVAVAPGGSFECADAWIRRLLLHGEMTIEDAYAVEYGEEYICSGSLTGIVRHSSYHSTAEDLVIDEDEMPHKQIEKWMVDRTRSQTSMAQLLLEDTPEIHNLLLGVDTLTLQHNSQTVFKGMLWRKNPKGVGKILLTYFDYLYQMKNWETMYYLQGNLHQFKVCPVTRGSGTAHSINLSGLYTSSIQTPVEDVTLLYTLGRHLDIDTSQTIQCGYNTSPSNQHEYAARYFSLRDSGGPMLRLAVALGNLTGSLGTGRSIYYWIYDMDKDSSNYDTAIITGTIDEAAIPTGATTYAWIVKDLASLHGLVDAPKFVKIVIGSVDNVGGGTLLCDWFGSEVALADNKGGKRSAVSASESSLAWVSTTVQDDTGTPQTVGLGPAAELEIMADWCLKRLPSDFTYSTGIVANFTDDMKGPTFANRTRQVSSTVWDIARVTAWYDLMSVDDHISMLANRMGRWWFNKIDVSCSSAVIPFLEIKNSTPGKVLEDLMEAYGVEMWNEFDGSDVKFKARDSVGVSDWSSYSDDEEKARTVWYNKDLEGIPPADRFKMERLIKGEYSETFEDIARQVQLDCEDGSRPVYTDFSQPEPWIPIIEKSAAGAEAALTNGKIIIDERSSPVEESGADLIQIPLDADKILLSTNELLKIIDSTHGWSKVGKVQRSVIQNNAGDLIYKVKMDAYARARRTGTREFIGRAGAIPGAGTMVPMGSSVSPFEDIRLGDTQHPVLDLSASGITVSPTTDWWIILGTSNATPASGTLQASSASEILIAPAKMILVGSTYYAYAQVNAGHLQGEWLDAITIKEAVLLRNVGKPTTYTGDRLVLKEWLVSDDKLAPGDLAAGEYYRAPVIFTRNTILHVTFGCP